MRLHGWMASALALASASCGVSPGAQIDSTTITDYQIVSAAKTSGERLYLRCAFCHMNNGQGVLGQIPPLAGSEYATNAAPAVPITIVLRGLQGPITVKDIPYHSAMTAYGTGVPMTDDEIAAVLTYVRSAWGNHASAIGPLTVAQVRAATHKEAGPVTAAELAVLARGAVVARAAPLR